MKDEQKARVIGLVCSPRLNGNTQTLVEEALRAAEEMGAETEIYLAGQENIAPCNGCDFCQDTAQCIIDDCMQELYIKLLHADGIIIGSPVYYSGVSAQAKALMDRTRPLGWKKLLRGKVSGVIVVGTLSGMSLVQSSLLKYMIAHQIVIAAASHGNGFNKGDVRQDARAMEEAGRVGRAVAAVTMGASVSPEPTARGLKTQKVT